MTIRSRLLLLVFAVWFPAVGAFTLLAMWAHSRDEAAARATLRQVAESLSVAVERELDKKAVMASTLAASGALSRGDFPTFQLESRAALQNDPHAWAFIIDPARPRLNTLLQHPEPHMRLPDAPVLPQGPGPQAHFVLAGMDARRPVVVVFTALPPASALPINVGVAFDLTSLQGMMDQISLPENAIAKVLDQQQRIIVRSRDANRWLGETVTDELLTAARNGSAEFLSSRIGGVASLTYLTPPNQYGWAAAVAVPEAALSHAAAALTARVVAVAAALLLIGLLLALVWTRRINQPITALLDATAQLVRNEIPPQLTTGLPEADEVGAALYRAAQATRRSAHLLEARVAEAVRQTEAAQASLFESQKREAIGRLTGGMAHDFNNLLQTISMGLQMVDRTVGDGPHRRALDGAFRACGKAADLIRQMLTFGRAQALRPQPVAMEDFILKALELTTRAIDAKVSLQATVEPGTRPAYADPIQFELALLNLVFNARDAMPKGGAIVICACNADADKAHAAGATGDGPFVALKVSDTGTGMDPQTLARATEPFFTTKPVGAGSGLGLAQVVSFARQSGGGVCLQSEVGRGTCVHVYLPTARTDMAAQTVPAPEAAPRRALRILMVEDDVLVSNVVVAALEAAGHHVTPCSRASEAVAALSAAQDGAHRFDVLFTDIVMPGDMDGHDLAVWCREHHPDTAIVLTTGYSAKAAGSTALLLRKPFAIEDLLSALDRAASTRRASEAVA
ncbi:MAG: ATP-binding protein [Pseudomonadota bacterium]